MTKHTQPAADAALVRKLPKIPPANVLLNADGFAFRQMFVRCPAGLILDDLKEPKIWADVQGSTKSLRRLDLVVLAAHDESWIAEAWVSEATENAATLAKPRVTELKSRASESLLADSNYAVTWVGNGYAVKRFKDGHIMTAPVATRQIAERDLRNLYPKKVAA